MHLLRRTRTSTRLPVLWKGFLVGVKLTDLKPEWVNVDDRKGLGVIYGCLVGSHHDGKPCPIRNVTLFANPLDGGPPWPGNSRSLILKLFGEEERYNIRGCGECRWNRNEKTTTFEDLTLTPSCDNHQCGHMTLTNGVFQ